MTALFYCASMNLGEKVRGERQKGEKGIIVDVLIHMQVQIKLGGLKQSHWNTPPHELPKR